MADTSCVECGEQSSYKCPTCSVRYCSVPCCKSHKSKCQKSEASIAVESAAPEITFHYPTEDTVDVEKLKLLSGNEKLKQLLKDKYLKDMLVNLNSQPNPERMLKRYMLNETFLSFVDTVLNVVEPQENSKDL